MALAAEREAATQALRTVIARAVLHNEGVATAVGMSHSEMQTLHLLQLHGTLTPGQLAELTGLTSGSVTGVLDRLAALGFAGRSPHPSDRRKVVVTVDEQRVGAVLAPHYAKQATAVEAALSSYGPADLALIAGFLDKLSSSAT